MPAVFKYSVTRGTEHRLQLPQGARLLGIDLQQGQLYVWALVEPERPAVERLVRLYPTGANMRPDVRRTYIGTVIVNDGRLALHAFEEES